MQKLSGFQSVELDASEASSQREEANGLIAARRAAGAAGSDAVALRDERALSRPTQVAYVPRGYSASHSKLQSYRPGTEPEVGDVVKMPSKWPGEWDVGKVDFVQFVRELVNMKVH